MMTASIQIDSETNVSLEQMLAARELRAARQLSMLARFAKPLVSMTIVMPGPAKDGSLPRRLMLIALGEIEKLASTRNWRVLSHEFYWQNTGPEAIYVIDADPQQLKSATVELEDQHPLGRLWDLDVMAPGPRLLSRKELALQSRRCLACERPAAECGRSRRHPLDELLSTIQRIANEYDHRQQIQE